MKEFKRGKRSGVSLIGFGCHVHDTLWQVIAGSGDTPDAPVAA